MAAYASAAPGGIHGGTIVSGPSGVVTDHGAIGPAGHGLGGWGGWGAGHGLWGGHGAAVVAAPVAHAVVAGPGYGWGVGHGLGGWGGHGLGYGLGLGHGIITNGGGTIGLSGHGVTVKGPATVPATIAGPAGKIVADGLYGVPTHHGHGW